MSKTNKNFGRWLGGVIVIAAAALLMFIIMTVLFDVVGLIDMKRKQYESLMGFAFIPYLVTLAIYSIWFWRGATSKGYLADSEYNGGRTGIIVAASVVSVVIDVVAALMVKFRTLEAMIVSLVILILFQLVAAIGSAIAFGYRK